MKASRTPERRLPAAGQEVAEQLRLTADALEEAINVSRLSRSSLANSLMQQVRRARDTLAKAGVTP